MYRILEAETKSRLLALMPKWEEYQDGRLECDYELCYGKCPLIGMTANYAAKHKKLLQKLKPRVCIVEEAGEVPKLASWLGLELGVGL